MDDNSLMPFGKFKGMALRNVPDDYLYWLSNEEIDPKYHELEDYIKDNILSIKANANKNKYYNKE